MDRIFFYLNKRGAEQLRAECIVYSNKYGLLGKTPGADDFLREAEESK